MYFSVYTEVPGEVSVNSPRKKISTASTGSTLSDEYQSTELPENRLGLNRIVEAVAYLLMPTVRECSLIIALGRGIKKTLSMASTGSTLSDKYRSTKLHEGRLGLNRIVEAQQNEE